MTLSDMPTKNGAEPIRGEKVRRLSCSERGVEVARCQSKVRMEEKRMKQGFDKLEAFRCSLNALTKLYCNEPDAYDTGRAAAMLQQLTKEWRCDENHVVMMVAQMAKSAIDARLRHLVQQTVEKSQLPLTEGKFRENWENLSEQKKMELVDSTISLLQGMKKEGY